jgi:hypothetical protein
MGLEGTLRVFSLAEIFQVLGLQRKSGVLVVDGDEDTITISFLGGQVVSAESRAFRLENQIGSLLVRAGRLDEAGLARALEMQKESQQRLGFLLIRERLVTPEDLREALRLQIFRTVYRAFRWSDGRFRFSQEGPIEYDADHMSPVPTESVLMEAAQMLDEWPLLTRRIPSNEVVFRRAPGVESLRLVGPGGEAGEGALAVSKNEAETWRWVDGKRPVSEILERAFLSDFDVLKGLSDLVDRNLIVEGRLDEPGVGSAPAAVRRAPAVASAILWAAVVVLAALAVWLVPKNPWNALLRGSNVPALETLFKAVSLDRLVRLERAVRVFYDGSGRYPRSLEDLVGRGILREQWVRDPYGRNYRYILRSEDGKFGLYGRDAAGQIDLDLSFDRTLAPVAELRPAPSRAVQSETRPGVQVIE